MPWLPPCRNGAPLGAWAAVLGEESDAVGEIRAKPQAVAANPLAAKRPHFVTRAKRIIYLHMVGAPSQLDLFDYKPVLVQNNGKACPKHLIEGERFAFLPKNPRLLDHLIEAALRHRYGPEAALEPLAAPYPERAHVAAVAVAPPRAPRSAGAAR